MNIDKMNNFSTVKLILLVSLLSAFTGFVLVESPKLMFALILFLILLVGLYSKPERTLLYFGIFLVLQAAIAAKSGGSKNIVNMIDEATIILATILLVIKKIIKKEEFSRGFIGIPLIGTVLVGIMSSLVYYKGGKLSIPFLSLILTIKGFLIFYIFSNLKLEEGEIKKYLKVFLIIGIFCILVGFIELITPDKFRSFFNFEGVYYRSGQLSVGSFLGHPGLFGRFMAILSCFSLAFYFIYKKYIYIFFSILFILGIFLSLRRTPLIGLMAAFCIAIYFAPNYKRQYIYLSFSAIFVLFSLIFYKEILDLVASARHYYIDVSDPYKNAREALYLTSIKIAKDYFPFGSGLGTFGGWMSRVEYSDLYYKYGLNRVWGLSPKTGNFINDTFWPHIIAEIGFIGTFFYALIFIQFFRIIKRGINFSDSPFMIAFSLGSLMTFIVSLVESIKGMVYEQSLWIFLIMGSIGIINSYLQTASKKFVSNVRE